MKNKKGITILAGATLLFVVWGAQAILAPSLTLNFVPQAIAAEKPFYEGKTINILVPGVPGGGYDVYARLLSRHMGKHIPGKPRVVVENMDGAGGLIAGNHLYNRVKPDGLTFMIFNHMNIIRQLTGDPHVLLDVRKMRWIGTASDSPNMCVVRNGARYQKIEDMINAKEPLILAASSGDSREYYPKILNEVLHTNLKIITGYKSGGAIFVAVESREAEGCCGVGWDTLQAERPNWIEDKFASIFLQLNPVEKVPELKNVPWIMDYIKTPADRELVDAAMGTQAIVRSFVAPPGVPDDRLEVLRKAFMETMKDPDLVADAARTKSPVKFRTGPEVEAFIKSWFSISKDSVEKIRRIYFPSGF
jgi:tripartite-type tricarboxylate transporter receptor subunit TctC